MKSRAVQIRFGVLVCLLAALVWGFRELIFSQLPFVFRNPQEDMSFGWYVPLFSLYVVWVERRKILESIGAPSALGLVLAVPFLLLGFIGVRGIQIRFGVLAFAGLCLTVPWALFGRATARRILFPCLFLLFCIPLATFLDVVTVHLRLLASSVAYGVLSGFGADVVRQGTMLMSRSGAFSIDIAEPCSGLRSIFALMALTAGYAYFNQPTWIRRGLLFALSVPLAVFGNVMRILTIAIVGTYASSEFATGFYHDYSGYVVFLVAILLMVGAGELINRVCDRLAGASTKSAEAEPGAPTADVAVRAGGWAVVTALAVAVVGMMAVQSNNPEPLLCEAPEVKLVELPGFTSEAHPMSESEKTMLPEDTRIEKRLYTAEDGHWYMVSLVVGGRHKGSIHRPELCLPAQGFLMTDPRTAEIGGTFWRMITLDGGVGRPSLGFAYTFFNQAGFRTASHVSRIFRDVWDRSVHNRIDRWVMITVNSSRADDRGLRQFLSRLKEVVR